MKKDNKILKAFTLMEIGLSLLIISILVIVCIPIVSNQAKKTDEYAYFMAYKTVEKMGVQIVAFGDPEDSTEVNNTAYDFNAKDKFNLKKYLLSYSDKFFKFLNPKAEAAIETSTLVTFPSYEYDYVRLCLGNKFVIKEYDASGEYYYSDSEILSVQAESYCAKLRENADDIIKKRFMCKNMDYSTVYAILSGTNLEKASYRPKDYCLWLAQNCSGAYDCSSDKKLCYKMVEYSQTDTSHLNYGVCNITVPDFDINYTPESANVTDTTLSYESSCDNFGFINMTGTPCNCLNGYVKTLNNSNVCCPKLDSREVYYKEGAEDPCMYCDIGAYNENTKSCCPSHSIYSPAQMKCVCDEGYIPNSSDNLTQCNTLVRNCPAGTHLHDGSCVTNSSIIKAQRLCELVKANWNISNANCDTFTNENDIDYYKELYTAITKNNTPYLSTKAVVGAFNNIEPNIIFSNGLRMWILGNKSASIPGLSFNPDFYTSQINVCNYKSNIAENACTGGNNFYCKNDEKCFTIDSGTFEEESNANNFKLSDARTCCSTANFTDLLKMYEAHDYLRDPRVYAISGFTVFVDINGTKDNDELGGGGTLWKDVFPFYIATNGKVYPGYPLNAAKAHDSSKDSTGLYQGGNSSALSADVFYYDIVDNKRKKIVVYPSVPYARALCFALDISAYTPYCQNLGSKYRINSSQTTLDNFIYSDDNPCYKHRCYVKLKNKVKYL